MNALVLNYPVNVLEILQKNGINYEYTVDRGITGILVYNKGIARFTYFVHSSILESENFVNCELDFEKFIKIIKEDAV